MFCPSCGTEHPDTANYCMKCGLALTAAATPRTGEPRWEFKDVTIPINLMMRETESANRLILDRLQKEGEDSWHPEGLTDFQSLLTARRDKTHLEVRGGIFSRHDVTIVDSITLRLKCLVV